MILFMGNISLINDAGTLLILLISGLLILKGQFTVGLYTSFSLYSVKVFASTQGIASLSIFFNLQLTLCKNDIKISNILIK